MFCTRCGVQLSDADRYCSQCGSATANAPQQVVPVRKLMRSRTDKKIAGVCGGVAEYFELDPTLVRLAWLCFVFFPLPGGVLAYIIAWIVLPKEPYRLPAASAPGAPAAVRV